DDGVLGLPGQHRKRVLLTERVHERPRGPHERPQHGHDLRIRDVLAHVGLYLRPVVDSRAARPSTPPRTRPAGTAPHASNSNVRASPTSTRSPPGPVTPTTSIVTNQTSNGIMPSLRLPRPAATDTSQGVVTAATRATIGKGASPRRGSTSPSKRSGRKNSSSTASSTASKIGRAHV